MIRTILLSSVLGGALAVSAPTAEAGDFSLIFGIGDRHGNSVRVKVGDRDDHRIDRHRGDRHVRSGRHERDVRVSSHRGHRSHRTYHRTHRHHAPRYRVITERVWVAGHYDNVDYQVRLPGITRRVKVPARYEWHTDRCGRRHRDLVRRSYYKTITGPDRYETRTRRVFHPGRFETQTRKIRI